MLPRAVRLLSYSLLTLLLGCAMCPSPDDYTYSAYGGRWQRDNPVEGRVGSVFAPAGDMAAGDLFDVDGTFVSTDGSRIMTQPDSGSSSGEEEPASEGPPGKPTAGNVLREHFEIR